MSLVSDGTLQVLGHKLVSPFNKDAIQPCSYELTLGKQVRVFDRNIDSLNVRDIRPHTQMYPIPEQGFLLYPNGFCLLSSAEKITVPDNMAAQVNGKSSLGRLGLIVHSTAGFVDAGFEGEITFEVTNINNSCPIGLYPGMPFAQLVFWWLDKPAVNPYSADKNHYQSQSGPTESRYGL